jgi:hypothetical protein
MKTLYTLSHEIYAHVVAHLARRALCSELLDGYPQPSNIARNIGRHAGHYAPNYWTVTRSRPIWPEILDGMPGIMLQIIGRLPAAVQYGPKYWTGAIV